MEAIFHWLGVKKALAIVGLFGAVVSLKFVREEMTIGSAALMVLGGWSTTVFGTETVMFYAGIPDKHLLGTGFFVAVFSMSLCAAVSKAINTIDLGGIVRAWLTKRRG